MDSRNSTGQKKKKPFTILVVEQMGSPASHPIPATCVHTPRSLRGGHSGSHPSTSKKSTAFPSSGSLVATHDYYQCHLGSTPSDSSSASAKYPGEATFYHSGLPKAHPAHQWASFFARKFTLWFMATVLESPEHLESPQASSGTSTCDLAQEATRKQPGGQSCKATLGPHPERPDFQRC
ncbi:pancreatic progenitor cell differentiation and proliferation factor-like [Myotis daubentonii]|uniref:pancreatic progenitor cell differentiation and proliferation factor-like n=1 Tax=Myotis daubentonii TaxID=98922 RepID=UPI0028736FA3|nr:pancreatic progenitor cell differentiation and proliferation factor-like [Myotis daubentonii]